MLKRKDALILGISVVALISITLFVIHNKPSHISVTKQTQLSPIERNTTTNETGRSSLLANISNRKVEHTKIPINVSIRYLYYGNRYPVINGTVVFHVGIVTYNESFKISDIHSSCPFNIVIYGEKINYVNIPVNSSGDFIVLMKINGSCKIYFGDKCYLFKLTSKNESIVEKC